MAGDTEFEAQLAACRPELLRFAQWLTRDRSMAEDVVQETMLRAWKAQASLTDRTALRPWLLSIVRREFSRLRDRQGPVAVDVDVLVATDDPALTAADQVNTARCTMRSSGSPMTTACRS